jgi:hypothetical protein
MHQKSLPLYVKWIRREFTTRLTYSVSDSFLRVKGQVSDIPMSRTSSAQVDGLASGLQALPFSCGWLSSGNVEHTW